MKYSDLLEYAASFCGIPKEKLIVRGASYNDEDEVLKGFTIYCNGLLDFKDIGKNTDER